MKKWQVVLICVAVIASVVSVWLTLRGSGPRIPNSVVLVDITNGDLFTASTKRALMFPVKHPDTKEEVLWPVHQTDSGDWLIAERYLPHLKDSSSKPVSVEVVDMSSGAVLRPKHTRRRVDVYGDS